MRCSAAASAIVVICLSNIARGQGQSPPGEPAGPDIDAYGFVRLDAIFDDSRLSNPQFPFFVASEPGDSQAETTIHPRLTRVGLNVLPYQLGASATLSGKIEADFQNGGRESRAIPRLRHGYLALAAGVFELLAGQTWDLASPLYPAANGDSLMWNAGNLGDRRAQIRLTGAPALGRGAIRIAAAVGMTGAVDGQDLDVDMRPDGQDGLPTAQGLVELKLAPVTAGTWAHYARETIADGTDFDSTAVGGHARVDITDASWVQGEIWYGKNLADLRGAIGQDVNSMGEEIAAAGGWLEAGLKPLPPYTVAAGFTIDDPIDDDLDPNARRLNYAGYLVQLFRPWKPIQLGLDYLYWATWYIGAPVGRAHRMDLHATLFFE